MGNVKFLNIFQEIRMLVKNYQPPDREKVKAIEKKLDKCRNQNNNPDSDL